MRIVIWNGTDIPNYFVHDHLYSPVATLNNQGNVSERFEYSAYGQRNVLDDDYDSLSSTYTTVAFTGQRQDEFDGGDLVVMYYKNRYYDTETGRFLTRDPLGSFDGQNFYQYVASRPISMLDTFGLFKGAYISHPDIGGNAGIGVTTEWFDRWVELLVDGKQKIRKIVGPGMHFFDFDYNWLSRAGGGSVTVKTCVGQYTRDYDAENVHYEKTKGSFNHVLIENGGLTLVDASAEGSYVKYNSDGDHRIFWRDGAAVWESAIRVVANYTVSQAAGTGKGLLYGDRSPFGVGNALSGDDYYERETMSRKSHGWSAPHNWGAAAILFHKPPNDKWFIMGTGGTLSVASRLKVTADSGGSSATLFSNDFNFPLPGQPQPGW